MAGAVVMNTTSNSGTTWNGFSTLPSGTFAGEPSVLRPAATDPTTTDACRTWASDEARRYLSRNSVAVSALSAGLPVSPNSNGTSNPQISKRPSTWIGGPETSIWAPSDSSMVTVPNSSHSLMPAAISA